MKMKRYTATLVKGKHERIVYVLAESPDGAVRLLKEMDEYAAWLVRGIR
jgi:hypothetical protein